MSSLEWVEAMQGVWATFVQHLPSVVTAVVLLAVGWVVAKLLALAARVLVERLLTRLAAGPRLGSALDASGARAVAPTLFGAILFWLVLMVFVVATVEVLGLPILTDLLGRLTAYAPNIIAAVALAIAGLVIARLVRGSVARGAILMRLEHQAEAVAGFSYALIVAITAVMALEQLGFEGSVLEVMLAVTFGSVLAAGGLAFALGARSAVANIVAARYVTQLCRVGQRVQVHEIRGTVVQLTSTTVVVEFEEGRVIIPAAQFHESCPVLLEGP